MDDVESFQIGTGEGFRFSEEEPLEGGVPEPPVAGDSTNPTESWVGGEWFPGRGGRTEVMRTVTPR